jgi:hypothetical protein
MVRHTHSSTFGDHAHGRACTQRPSRPFYRRPGSPRAGARRPAGRPNPAGDGTTAARPRAGRHGAHKPPVHIGRPMRQSAAKIGTWRRAALGRRARPRGGGSACPQPASTRGRCTPPAVSTRQAVWRLGVTANSGMRRREGLGSRRRASTREGRAFEAPGSHVPDRVRARTGRRRAPRPMQRHAADRYRHHRLDGLAQGLRGTHGETRSA